MSYKAVKVDSLPENVAAIVRSARQQHHVVVLVTGVFDLLHGEHQAFLQKAKAAGEVLIVGVESDLRSIVLKGPGRPVMKELERATAIEALGVADAVFILPEDFDHPTAYRGLLRTIQPAILAVSSHSEHQEAKAEMMAEVGGELRVVHEHNPDVSTTKILAKQNV